ncbi:MAG: CHRD domain-containing protein [Planctomycetales bacterium]|nr:CHRD domain-containing protein [Planctomycetales bacterium]
MLKTWSYSVVAIALAATPSLAHESHYTALFTGADPSATGTAALTLSADHATLSYAIQLTGLDLGGQTATIDDNVIGLHFHSAPAGSNGPVVFGLLGSPTLGGTLNPALTDDADDIVIDAVAGTITGAWETSDNPTLSATLLDALNMEGLYLNVHTEAFRGGATRGQIVPVPEPSAVLSGLILLSAATRPRRGR